MKDRLKALDGITYREWQRIKKIVDEKFKELIEKNIFNYYENDLIDNSSLVTSKNTASKFVRLPKHELY